MKQITIEAKKENLYKILDFIDEELDTAGCPGKAKVQIDIAAEELFVNIAGYAYENSSGEASVIIEVSENGEEVSITFIDSGIPYDPLKKADPDTTLSADEREIGGLGIFMVKKSMDDVDYEYKDGRNILKIKKSLILNKN